MSRKYFLAKEHCVTAFDRRLPAALTVPPGSVVTFETGDGAYERLWQGESPDDIDDQAFNAVTGPVYVTGAEPGDALQIEVQQIVIRRAWAVWLPDYGPLGRHTDKVQTRPVTITGGRLRLSERLTVPCEPMIGCIGVAPARGRGSTLEPAYPYGGNLDLRELSPGATLLLPVQVPGGLLSLGDLHAAMGAGEATWVGIEAAGQATVRLGLQKGMKLKAPRLRVAAATICVAPLNKKGTLEQACLRAIEQAYELLTSEYALDPFEAQAYISARVDLRMGGPASPTVLAVVPDP